MRLININTGTDVVVVPAQVQPHEQEVVGVDLEQVLAVLAYQHQSERGAVDGEAEEAVSRRRLLLSLSRRRVSTLRFRILRENTKI